MEDSRALWNFNLSERERWLMRCHGRPYFCTRLSALFVLAMAMVPLCLALELVHGWLLYIGLLRAPGGGMGTPRFYDDMVAVYAASSLGAWALLWLARELWMFRARAWWLAMTASLLAGLHCLFAERGVLAMLPVFGAIYVLLMLSYPIFAERVGDP